MIRTDAFAEFERFVEEKKILSLESRPKSIAFITDYHRWSFSVCYYRTSFGKEKFTTCRLEQYKKYTKRDFELIDELRSRFLGLCREKLSETVRETE